MSSEQRHRPGPVIAMVASLALIVAYPLSLGPALMLHRLTGESDSLLSAIETAYCPLTFLPERLTDQIVDWGNICKRLIPSGAPAERPLSGAAG